MGVPKFYRWISERYPCLSETVKDHQIPEFDNLYLDMNGIIHVCSHPDDGNAHFRITEEKIFTDVFHYLEVLFRMIKPRKVFFMAIDGVAPRAKMNQQRGRRFRSAKDAENLEKQALSRGETLPTEARFDSNCITPGTEFMVRLHAQLQYFIVNKISNDKLWQGVTVYLSGHETPGEGEHKIMDFIRSEKASPGYDNNTRHCLYGLDADLIMLGLTTHEPHFALLREEVRFGKQSQKRSNTVEETTFHLLHISLLREYLDLEFSSVKQNLMTFQYDLERIIDDWVLMGFLVGNDFIPHLPHLHIASDALPTIWKTYKQTLPLMGGYINDKGKIDMCRLETFLVALSESDLDKFSDGYADQKYMESKSASHGGKWQGNRAKRRDRGVKQVTTESQVDELDDFSTNGEMRELEAFDDECREKAYTPERNPGEDSMSYEFRKHKSNYYFDKMALQATDDVLAQQAKDYVLGLQWILYYYYTGVPSWGWFFPHHYAPYMSDLHSFSNIEPELEPGRPFFPFQQLMAVLPSGSRELLPDAYQPLMLSELSPIIDFYPPEFEFDMNGKQQDWEAVVLIPFIEELRLLEAMGTVEHLLTPAEKDRNTHGPCLIYDYCKESQGIYPSTLPAFPDIAHNHTRVSTKTWQDFVLPIDQLRGGLCNDVKPALFYPGFPTFQHIDHRSYLQKMGVTVFQQASRNENRIVQLLDDMDIDDIDIMSLGEELLGQSIWVNWPHMYEARVCTVETDEWKVELGGKDKSEIVKSSSDSNSTAIFMSLVESITERYEKRRGLDIGPTFVLIHAQPISGRKYLYLKDGRVTADKEWQPTSVPYVLQACVRNQKMLQCGVESAGSVQFFTLADIFPVGSRVYMMAQPYYGCEAEVLGHPEDRVRVKVTPLVEPDLVPAMRYNDKSRYMKAYELAQHLSVSSHFISRITGTMFLMKGKESLNVGLDLKNNKKNEECPGFTRKEGNDWLYSQSTEDIIYEYYEKFEGFLSYVSANLSKDKLAAETAFPTDTGERCSELMSYVKSLPTYKCARAKCGGTFLESPTIHKIEEQVDNITPTTEVKQQTMIVKPALIYKQYSLTSTMTPDPDTEYKRFDRVVNVRMGYTVPYGLRGTVIGIITNPDPRDTVIEVVFDSAFPCGLTTRCSPGRGYRCPPHALINVTHGQRVAKSKGLKSSRQPSATQAQKSEKLAARTTSSSYSTALATSQHESDVNPNKSNNSSTSSPKPGQMQVLKRPGTGKTNSANERGAFLKPTNQVKPVVKQDRDSPQQDGRPRDRTNSPSTKQTKKSSHPKPVKVINGGAKGESPKPVTEVKPSVKQSDRSGDEYANPSPILMSPSEFVTPKTTKLDGRQRTSAEKPDHADIWSKLKVASVQPLSETNANMGGASAALPATTDSMSQALAALNNIKISTPVAIPGATARNLEAEEKPQQSSSSPKAGDKIDIASLLGSCEKNTSNVEITTNKRSKPAKRELYIPGQSRLSNDTASNRQNTSEPERRGGGVTVQRITPAVQHVAPVPQAPVHPAPVADDGGFNFESLVTALEKNMTQQPTNQQLDQIMQHQDSAASNKTEDEDPIAKLSAQLEQQSILQSGASNQPSVSQSGQPQQGVIPTQQGGVPTQQSEVPTQQGGVPAQQGGVPVQHIAPMPHPQMRLPPPLGMAGVPVYQQYGQPVPTPRPQQLLQQWSMTARCPPPNFHMQQLNSAQGVPMFAATVIVGGMKFAGPACPNELMAVDSVSQMALHAIVQRNQQQAQQQAHQQAQQHQQHQQQQQQQQQMMQPGVIPQNHRMPGPAPASNPGSSQPPPPSHNSNFVPLQVTKKHVHEERIRTSSESQTSTPVDNTTLSHPDHAAGEAQQPTAGSTSSPKTTPNKPRRPKKATPQKTKASKVRLAANFGPSDET